MAAEKFVASTCLSRKISPRYFFRRYALSAWAAVAMVVILLVYKIVVIGW
jgi:hypothetical protein